MTSWKDKFKDFLVSIAEIIGLHPIDFIAIIMIPIIYFSARKYFDEKKKPSIADKIYDVAFFFVAIVIYIFFFLNLFGIYTYD